MSGHTPGPWCHTGWSITGQLAGNDFAARCAIDGAEWPKPQPQYCTVAESNGPNPVALAHGETWEDAQANARLIAAAPELLALAVALETAIREGLIRNAYDEDSAGVLADFAREAIAKAGAA